MRTASIIVGAVLTFGPALVSAQQNVPRALDDAAVVDAAPAQGTALQRELDAIRATEDTREANAVRGSENSVLADERRAYNVWVLTHSQRTYAWQYLSTIIIFFMVVFVVASGVALAAWQLHTWIARVRAYDRILLQRLEGGLEVSEKIVTEIGKPSTSEVTVTEKSLALSSPYVGVTILALSMGFFLAYLLLVYPIFSGP